MTESRAQRSHPTRGRGGRSRKADLGARVVAALAVIAIMWTGAVASAGAADRSPTPAPVKYFVVPARGNGPASLFEIAVQTLGDGSRFMQIFRLNKGRLQPNGGRLENPGVIEPGWVLELPPAASGLGVHFGPLPQPAPSASAAPHSRPPSRPGAASSSSPVDLLVTILALVIAGALVVIGVRLAWRPRRGRRRRVADGSRERRHDRFERPRTPAEPPSRPADVADEADWSWPSRMATPADWPADHPSRPQQAVDYRAWPADHPSRPQQAVDYRAWPADHPSRPQQAVDYRAWPADHPAGRSRPWTTSVGHMAGRRYRLFRGPRRHRLRPHPAGPPRCARRIWSPRTPCGSPACCFRRPKPRRTGSERRRLHSASKRPRRRFRSAKRPSGRRRDCGHRCRPCPPSSVSWPRPSRARSRSPPSPGPLPVPIRSASHPARRRARSAHRKPVRPPCRMTRRAANAEPGTARHQALRRRPLRRRNPASGPGNSGPPGSWWPPSSACPCLARRRGQPRYSCTASRSSCSARREQAARLPAAVRKIRDQGSPTRRVPAITLRRAITRTIISGQREATSGEARTDQ